MNKKILAGIFIISLAFCLLTVCEDKVKHEDSGTEVPQTPADPEILPAATVSAVTVSPTAASVNKGGGTTFSATVQGTNDPAQTVTWKIEGGILGTEIDNEGRLSVSGSEVTNAVLTVTATSTVDTTKSGTAKVTVTEQKATVSAVTVSPQSANILRNATQQFSANVSGTNNPSPSVTWSVTGAGAGTTINSDGLLSVSVNETAPHTLTVKAVSAVDPTKSGAASVTIPAPTVSAVTVSPSSASVKHGGTQAFTATVSGTNFPDQNVTWAIVETNKHSGTTINSSGLLTVSASETLTTLTIRATSNANSGRSATATVTVSESTIPVTLNSVTADGSASATTTKLTLTFDKAISGLAVGDISLSGVNGVNKVSLSGSGPSYTLQINGFTSGGTLTVSVAKAGYTVSGTPKTVTIYHMTPVTLSSVTADGSSSQTTKQLTLTFSQAIDGLSAADITLSGVNGVSKGTFTASGSTYTLLISNFTSNGTLSVSVAKSGYAITGTPRTVSIYYATSVTLNSVTANGNASTTTTQLTLNFSAAISGLTVNDIKLSDTAITKETLSASGSTYTLTISNVKLSGNLNVTVEKSGFNISGSSKTVEIFYAIPVTFSGVTQNGSATQTTTQLTLTFSATITNLSADDITISGVSGVTKGTLSGSGPSYNLGISGVTQNGTLSVAVAAKSGYNISGSPQTVAIFYAAPVTFSGVTQNGSASVTTTQLTLTFDKAIANLAASDITISGVNGVTRGTLSGSGPTYTLGINGVAQNGTLSVAVSKSGFNISGSPQTVAIFYAAPVAFSGVTANGSATQTTSQLTLTFSQAITGLAAADITLSGVTGVSKGTLSGSGPTYTLGISGFTAGGTLTVTIAAAAKPGYIISGSPKTATIYYYAEEVLVASYAANASNTYIELTSPTAYSIVNRENRNNVMKSVNPAEYAVGVYSLSAYKDSEITITFSADVKRVGAAGALNWQINNSDYPSVGSITNAAAGTWHSMSGTWTGIPSNNYPSMYLSTYQNDSDSTTYYIANFQITITTAPVDPPPSGPVTPPTIGVGGVLNPATTNTQLTGNGLTVSGSNHGGGNKWLIQPQQANNSRAYGYETWDESGSPGSASFTWYGKDKGGGLAFKAEWTNVKDFLARTGYNWNESKAHSAYGNIYCGFNFTRSARYNGNFSYIGIYGWSRNPGASVASERLVEYYIVEDSYGNRYRDSASFMQNIGNETLSVAEVTPSYTMDGGTYKVFKVTRTGDSISGNTTFTQFFSVRQTPRQNGTISITEHFKQWAERGMNLGTNIYECKFKVEAGGNESASPGTGTFDARLIQFYRANNDGTIIEITQ